VVTASITHRTPPALMYARSTRVDGLSLRAEGATSVCGRIRRARWAALRGRANGYARPPLRGPVTPMADSGFFDVPDGRLFYERAGTGPAIVWIHAAIADRRMWDREFDLYAKERTVVRYDVRGLGRSPPARAPYSDAQDLRLLLDHLGVGAVTIVGCSNGGRIALDFAVQHPDRVRGLLLVSPGLSGWNPELDPDGQPVYEADMARSGEIVAAWNAGRQDEALERLLVYWASATVGASRDSLARWMKENSHEIFTDASGQFGRAAETDTAARLGSIHAPTVVLFGDRDEPTMGYIVRRVVQSIPGARRVDVPGGDHLINLSRPEAFDAALTELLGRADGRSPGR
jgi:3-oxoadipate enol-lactonase